MSELYRFQNSRSKDKKNKILILISFKRGPISHLKILQETLLKSMTCILVIIFCVNISLLHSSLLPLAQNND